MLTTLLIVSNFYFPRMSVEESLSGLKTPANAVEAFRLLESFPSSYLLRNHSNIPLWPMPWQQAMLPQEQELRTEVQVAKVVPVIAAARTEIIESLCKYVRSMLFDSKTKRQQVKRWSRISKDYAQDIVERKYEDDAVKLAEVLRYMYEAPTDNASPWQKTSDGIMYGYFWASNPKNNGRLGTFLEDFYEFSKFYKRRSPLPKILIAPHLADWP